MTPMSLQSMFEARGVPLVELAPGQRVPRAFDDPAAEHLAARRNAGLFDFSFMGCMELKGAGSVALLHTIQPRDVGAIPVGRIRYTLLMREDSTVLNDATVWRTGDQSYLMFVGRRADLAFVAQDAAAYDVRAEDRSDQLAVIALQGPRSRAVLSRCLDMPRELRYFAFAEAEFEQRRCLVANIGYSGAAGYEIVLGADTAPALWQAICSEGTGERVRECGFVAADSLRIEAGHILFANELRVNVTPLELGFERLIELQPQRRHALRSTPSRRLVGLLFEERLSFPSSPTAGRTDLVVTSACFSPTLGRRIGLGFVPWEARYPGTRVSAGEVRATVARLPFYDPAKRLVRVSAAV